MGKDYFSEKVSVNINTSTLSNIDILVDNGYYSNRSDFINQALREALQKYQNTLDRIIDGKTESGKESADRWFVGVYSLGKREVEEARKRGEKITITGYGVLGIGEDIDEKILFEVVRDIQIRGKVIGSAQVKAHYGIK